ERPAAVPALVPGLRDDAPRLRVDLDGLPALQPVDARKTVAGLAPALCIDERRRERLDVLGTKAQCSEARAGLVRSHGGGPPARLRRRTRWRAAHVAKRGAR